MNFKQLIITIVICVLHFHESKGQVVFDDYTLSSWNSKNGLPTELILDMVQDNDNFLWLSTYEGLYRFDGVQFKSFNSNTHKSFKTNNIYKPIVDKNNALWIPTQFGAMLKLKGNKVESISNIPKIHRVITKFDNGVYLYMTQDNQYLFFNPNTRQWIIKPIEYLAQYLKQNKASNIAATLPDGRLIFTDTRNRIYCFENNKLKTLSDTEGAPNELDFIGGIITTSYGEIFVVNDQGIKIWKEGRLQVYPGTEKIKINTLGGSRNPHLVQDKNGNLWLGHTKGVAFRKKGQQNFQFLSENNRLFTSSVTCLLVDPENNIWIGSETGLYKITESKIKTITEFGNISINRTTGVTSRKNGDLLINAPSENSIYEYSNGKVSPIQFRSKNLQGTWESFHIKEDQKGNFWVGAGGLSFKIGPYGNETNFAKNESIRYVYEDKEGKIWFGVSQKGIGYLDNDSLKILPLNHNFSGENISTINKINNGEWLISSFNNGLIWVKKNGEVISIRDTLGFPAVGVFKTYQKSEGTFWAASNLGLFYFNGKIFVKIKDDKAYLANSFFDIIVDKKGDFWLPSNKGIVQISSAEIRKIEKEKSEQIKTLRYDDGDGMLNRQCTGARHSTLSLDGKVFIPTLQGIAVIDPNKMVQNTIVPKVVITGFYYNGTLMDTINPVVKPGIHQYIIEYSATSYTAPLKVEFKYMLEGYDTDWSTPTTDRKVTFTNLPSGTYTFKVLASNNDGVWTEVPAMFEFTVMNHLYELWWFKVLLLLGFGALVYGIVFWRSRQILMKNKELEELVQTRTKNLYEVNTSLESKKISLEKTLTELKSTQAQLIQSEKMASLGELTAGIAHEIQNPLNFVNNFSEVSNELMDEMNEELNKGDIEEAKAISVDIKSNLEKINHHGKRASDIVKGMLEHSRISTGQKELTDINTLCGEYLRLAYQGQKAKNKDFNATMETQFDHNLPKVEVMPQDIGRVLLNLISNAFYAVNERNNQLERAASPSGVGGKGGQGQVHDYLPTVSITTQLTPNNQLLIAVKDNGSGIPETIKEKIFQPFFTTKPTGQGTGLGLSLSYDIVKAHGGELKVETNKREGSEFIITLPIQTKQNNGPTV